MKFTEQLIPLAAIDCPSCDDAAGIADAEALLDAGSEAPPIVVTQRKNGSYDLYDGRRRVHAARAKGLDTILAAVCPTTKDAALVRHFIGHSPSTAEAWQRLRAGRK